MEAIPERQAAIRLTGPGRLRLDRDKAVPVPTGTQFLGQVECVGLCYSDVKLRDRFDAHPRKAPVRDDAWLRDVPGYAPGTAPTVPGHEVVLRVVAAGRAVTGVSVGRRYVVQADFRHLPTALSQGAFGYDFEGGLQQYVLLDERVTDGYLVAVPDGVAASRLALVEPWACVEAAFTVRERRTLKPGGTALVVGDGRLDGLDVTLGSGPVDDLLYSGSDPDELERRLPLVADGGLVLIATSGHEFARPVRLPVGRAHYGNVRFAATTSDRFADALAAVPTGPSPDDHVVVLGAGGPMGIMAMVRAIATAAPGALVEGGVRDPGRAAALRDRISPAAAARGVDIRLFDPRTEHPRGPVDHCLLMAPDPDLIAAAIAHAAPHGIVNVFAGPPPDALIPVDLNRYARDHLYFTGTSGSTPADMRAVVSLMSTDRLDTNLPVAAVSGLAGALDGLDAVAARTFPGKIVVYPPLVDLGLYSLPDLAACYPTVGALMPGGRWTADAESELHRVAAE